METLLKAINAFIERKLNEETGQNEILKFILERTGENISHALRELGTEEEERPTAIVDICDAIEKRGITFSREILRNIGQEKLADEIADCLREVQIKILINELSHISESEDSITPQKIQNLDPELYKALQSLLAKLNFNGMADWELLEEHLPADLRKKYSTDEEREEEKIKERITELSLEEIVALFREDPKKLAYILQLYGLSEEEIKRIIFVSFKGLHQGNPEKKIEKIMDYDLTLEPVELKSEISQSTEKDSIPLEIKVPKGASHVYVLGNGWHRDIKINGAKLLNVPVLLKRGEENEIAIIAYNKEKKERSEVLKITVRQEGEKVDEFLLEELLKNIKKEQLEEIEKDPVKEKIFRKQLEDSLIKHFTGDFKAGKRYVRSLMANQKNKFIISCLWQIIYGFESINREKFPQFQKGKRLYFYEKYCIERIRRARRQGKKGIILANEPGLGKTITALAALCGDDLVIVCPNSVASTWIEQEAAFFRKPFLVNLSGRPHQDRREVLENTEQPGVVTNVEFVRSKRGASEIDTRRTDEKFRLLNRRRKKGKPRAVIIDEAHFLKNESQQTEGAKRLEKDFALWLSASPWKDPDTFCRMMHVMMPKDERFQSPEAFSRAFPKNDPVTLRVLHMLQSEFTIRFLKTEVFQTRDPRKPLEEQKYALPAKKRIDPRKEIAGNFSLTEGQQRAILELFRDWEKWKEKYDKYMPKGRWAREDYIRGSDGQLVRKHALRQIANSPAYIGSREASPKHEAMKAILKEELTQDHKVLVFCRYHDQVDAYGKMLDGMDIDYCRYTGKIAKEGFKKDEHGNTQFFEKDEFENAKIGTNGRPITTTQQAGGIKMKALDYERHVFQNDPKKKIMLATYKAGSVGVNFTAADAIVEDDLPDTYPERYQAEDRIHRIDEDRPKYETRYYCLKSGYTDDFLNEMRRIEVGCEEEGKPLSAYGMWFRQGTYDEVLLRSLDAQKIIFELMNNGIATDGDVEKEEIPFEFRTTTKK